MFRVRCALKEQIIPSLCVIDQHENSGGFAMHNSGVERFNSPFKPKAVHSQTCKQQGWQTVPSYSTNGVLPSMPPQLRAGRRGKHSKHARAARAFTTSHSCF